MTNMGVRTTGIGADYVGIAAAVELAEQGHQIILVDAQISVATVPAMVSRSGR